MIFTTTKGDVAIEWNESEVRAEVYTAEAPREEIGSIQFEYVDDPSGDHLRVINMHLEGPQYSRHWLGLGIGRQCLIEAKRLEVPIIFAVHDGNSRSDGSHLTDMGPGFAAKMVDEGHAFWETDGSDRGYEDDYG